MTRMSPDREHELLAEIARLEDDLARCRREALTDDLVGCMNRRAWVRSLDIEEKRCTRHDLDAIVAVVDLDDFKRLNDREGHHAGDAVLCRCAEALRRAVRAPDRVARLGGDEFGVLALQTSTRSEAALTDRLSRALGDEGIAATIGTCPRRDADGMEGAWRIADRRMLAAKAGRRTARQPK